MAQSIASLRPPFAAPLAPLSCQQDSLLLGDHARAFPSRPATHVGHRRYRGSPRPSFPFHEMAPSRRDARRRSTPLLLQRIALLQECSGVFEDRGRYARQPGGLRVQAWRDSRGLRSDRRLLGVAGDECMRPARWPGAGASRGEVLQQGKVALVLTLPVQLLGGCISPSQRPPCAEGAWR